VLQDNPHRRVVRVGDDNLRWSRTHRHLFAAEEP
jgi:hypothetical protein